MTVATALAQTALTQPDSAGPKDRVADLVRQLDDEQIGERWYATIALGRLGSEAAESVGPLLQILANRSQHEHVRGGAAWALGRIGVASPEVIALLSETLDSNHVSVRRNSPKALGALGKAAQGAMAKLVTMLRDDDVHVQVNAAVALWRIERHAEAIPLLVAMTRRIEGPGPYQATVALGELGSTDDAVIGALGVALGHASADVNRAAVRSLGWIGPAAIPALRQGLSADDPRVRRGAVEALGRVGPQATAAIIEAMEDTDTIVRRSAARALGRLGPAAKTAESVLLSAVNDPDPAVRRTAASALGKIRQQ